MLIAGGVGFFMKKFNYPIAPLLLAYVLAPTMEKNFRQALQISDGSMMIFLQKPISLILVGFLLLTVCSPIFRWIIGRIKKQPKKGVV